MNAALKYKLLVTLLFILMPILIVLHQIIPPFIAAGILDRLATGDYASGDIWGSFGASLATYSLLILFTSTLGWRTIIYLIWTLEIRVLQDLMTKLHNKFMSLDMDFHANSFGGSLVSRSNKFISSYVRLADTLFFDLYTLFIMSVATGVVLWSRSPTFVILLYVLIALFISVSTLLTKKIRTLSTEEAGKQNIVTGYLADMITNVQAVKSFSSSEREAERFYEATQDVADTSTRLKWAQMGRENSFALFTSTLGALALITATVAVVRYGANIGTVFLMYTYTTNMTVRLWDFSQRTLRNVNKAIGDSREATEVLLRKPTIIDPVDPKPIVFKKGAPAVSFQSMTFAHDDEGLFNDLDLTIAKGEKIGLVGHSGSGKSTLASLLLRFKDIDSGSIKIGETDIREAKQDDVRKHISYVPQEPMLFHRTLAENISYGKPGSSQAEIISAAKKANAHEFIEKLPKGYKTLVGERGVKLSGGQRQRVAIARAMLKDAPILMLDEATSALDSESEKLIQDALWKLMKGRTAIVIAHRLSTIQKMDRIVILSDGNIIEEGSHDELLKKKGQYAKLWAHQSGGFLQD